MRDRGEAFLVGLGTVAFVAAVLSCGLALILSAPRPARPAPTSYCNTLHRWSDDVEKVFADRAGPYVYMPCRWLPLESKA